MPQDFSPDTGCQVSLRAVAPADEAFLLRVYASTRADEMALVPWTEAQREAFLKMQFDAQRQHYRTYYADAAHEIIEQAGAPVGRLYVSKGSEEIHILDITVLPEFRNRGVGTQLLRELMGEADATGRRLNIYVESFNPSLRLFERLGFRKTEENGIHFTMEWNGRSGS